MSTPPILVVMGVAGAGKTTVGKLIAKGLGWPFVDGDDLHPQANIDKMRSGVPLTDSDRAPWLEAIGDWIDTRAAGCEPGIVACSALKRAYRDRLRAGRPQVRIVYLRGTESQIAERLAHRSGHFWPAGLLATQFADLEPPSVDEDPIVVGVEQPPEAVAKAVIERLS
jgi:gluconokinase